MQETSEDVNLLTYGLAPDQNDLLNWANDDGRRRQIWKISKKGMTGTPDDSREWCCLNFQDNSKGRGIVIAFLYGQLDTHFPSGIAQIQSSALGTYPRVSAFENSGALYLRLSTGTNSYLELRVDENGASANKVVNGSPQVKSFATFD